MLDLTLIQIKHINSDRLTYLVREILENIKRGMAQHPWPALPNDCNQDIWSYYQLFWIKQLVCDDHLAVILQVPLIDKL